MTEKKKPEIIFQPGCFDHFDGTQEELDEFIKMIQTMDPEEMVANSQPLDLEALLEEEPEIARELLRQIGALEDKETTKRTLQ